ncbi:LysR family transcriptional regulator [Rhodobacteraceae bacterium RKSG542]|uniref:LysR family transcriptional regulator n=1 Tax=Pseudovibrio flavus TaxID=2529854 RepID=UPI0012BB9B9C|nr:LysR family transcriptional regulator [Pseudovibrio flavus]MTI17240.1 LysR family transcriptional regulator [Pseudovibrio flavus]
MLKEIWLRTFKSLVETGHFTKTAELLHMTQPGVSQHIKKLEDQLAVPLLNRVGKGFELTWQGQLLYDYAKRTLQDQQELLSRLREDDPYAGLCTFSCSGALAMLLLPAFLEHQKQFPTLNVSIEAAPNHRVISSIKDGTVDVGIVNEAVSDPSLLQEEVGKETLQLVVPASVAAKPVTYESLITLGMIDHPDAASYTSRLLSVNFLEDYKGLEEIPRNVYINQLGQILLPVCEGLGFTVLPSAAIPQDLMGGRIAAVPLGVEEGERLFFTTKRFKTLPTRYDWFRQKTRELLAESK